MTTDSTADNQASHFTLRFLPSAYLQLMESARAVDLDDDTAIIVVGQLYCWSGKYVDIETWSTKNGIRVGSSTHTYYPMYTELDVLAYLSGDAQSVEIIQLVSHQAPVTSSEINGINKYSFSPSTSSRMFGASDPEKVKELTESGVNCYSLVYFLGESVFYSWSE